MTLLALSVLLIAQLADSSPISFSNPAMPLSFGPGQAAPTIVPLMIPPIDQVAFQSPINGQQNYARNFEVEIPISVDPVRTSTSAQSVSSPSFASSTNAYSLASYADTMDSAAQFTEPPFLDSFQPGFASPEHGTGLRIAAEENSKGIVMQRRPREHRFRNWLGRHRGYDIGLGYERVMYAPMVLDTAISSSYAGVRIRGDRGLSAPDRLEYLWSQANGRGPDPETKLDLIDTMYRTELGNANAAVISEIGMRSLNPEVNPNTVGFGDMLVGAKALVYDGKCTKVSTLFLTYFNTGPTNRGLGSGHVSLEPGVLLRHQWSDATFLHSELKYRLPIAGTSGFAGDVLTTGWGMSTVWRDSDCYALIPTLELRTNSFLFGGMTRSDGTVVRIDGVTAVELYPGMRCAFSKSSMGIWEVGFTGGTTFADNDWFDSRMILDVRLIR